MHTDSRCALNFNAIKDRLYFCHHFQWYKAVLRTRNTRVYECIHPQCDGRISINKYKLIENDFDFYGSDGMNLLVKHTCYGVAQSVHDNFVDHTAKNSCFAPIPLTYEPQWKDENRSDIIDLTADVPRVLRMASSPMYEDIVDLTIAFSDAVVVQDATHLIRVLKKQACSGCHWNCPYMSCD